MLMKPRRPRAVVLCPTRELSEQVCKCLYLDIHEFSGLLITAGNDLFQVFRVAKSVSHHARFRCTMVSGGGRLRPQEDSLNGPIDMVVGTPGRVLQHIEEGNIVYGDIKYVVIISPLMHIGDSSCSLLEFFVNLLQVLGYIFSIN